MKSLLTTVAFAAAFIAAPALAQSHDDHAQTATPGAQPSAKPEGMMQCPMMQGKTGSGPMSGGMPTPGQQGGQPSHPMGDKGPGGMMMGGMKCIPPAAPTQAPPAPVPAPTPAPEAKQDHDHSGAPTPQ